MHTWSCQAQIAQIAKNIKLHCAPFSPIYSDQRHVLCVTLQRFSVTLLSLKALLWFDRPVVVHSKECVASEKE